jgi:hypothetical protein
MATGRDVQIGDRTVRIQSFKVYKAMKAGEIVSEITKMVPQIGDSLTEYTRKYEAENFAEIDRATALFQYRDEVEHISDEAWRASENKLRIPQSPSPQEQMTAVFSLVFDTAKEHVLTLLALLITPDSELRDAHRADGVDQKIAEYREVLEHEADITDLVDLTAAAAEVVREQFAGKADQIKKIRNLWAGQEETTTETKNSTSTPGSTAPSSGSLTTSSGTTTTFSSGSPGEKSSASAN